MNPVLDLDKTWHSLPAVDAGTVIPPVVVVVVVAVLVSTSSNVCVGAFARCGTGVEAFAALTQLAAASGADGEGGARGFVWYRRGQEGGEGGVDSCTRVLFTGGSLSRQQIVCRSCCCTHGQGRCGTCCGGLAAQGFRCVVGLQDFGLLRLLLLSLLCEKLLHRDIRPGSILVNHDGHLAFVKFDPALCLPKS